MAKVVSIISNHCFFSIAKNDLTTSVHTVWKLWNFTLTLFCQKLRESNESDIHTAEIIKEFISRNIFSVMENLSFFHTVVLTGNT